MNELETPIQTKEEECQGTCTRDRNRVEALAGFLLERDVRRLNQPHTFTGTIRFPARTIGIATVRLPGTGRRLRVEVSRWAVRRFGLLRRLTQAAPQSFDADPRRVDERLSNDCTSDNCECGSDWQEISNQREEAPVAIVISIVVWGVTISVNASVFIVSVREDVECVPKPG